MIKPSKEVSSKNYMIYNFSVTKPISPQFHKGNTNNNIYFFQNIRPYLAIHCKMLQYTGCGNYHVIFYDNPQQLSQLKLRYLIVKMLPKNNYLMI